MLYLNLFLMFPFFSSDYVFHFSLSSRFFVYLLLVFLVKTGCGTSVIETEGNRPLVWGFILVQLVSIQGWISAIGATGFVSLECPYFVSIAVFRLPLEPLLRCRLYLAILSTLIQYYRIGNLLVGLHSMWEGKYSNSTSVCISGLWHSQVFVSFFLHC